MPYIDAMIEGRPFIPHVVPKVVELPWSQRSCVGERAIEGFLEFTAPLSESDAALEKHRAPLVDQRCYRIAFVETRRPLFCAKLDVTRGISHV
jgi:hypothetical protein